MVGKSAEEFPLASAFDVPGYISMQFQAADDKNLFIRIILSNESFWVELSRCLIKERGQKGKEIIYTVGKQYGYRFSTFNRFPKGNLNKVTVRALWDFFAKLTIIRKVITIEVNPKHGTMLLELDGLVVSAKSGMWYGSVGTGVGQWCQMLQDYSIEGSLKKIEGTKELVMFGSPNALAKEGFEVIKSDKMPSRISMDDYMLYNKPVNSYSAASFGRLMADGTVSFKNGILYAWQSERVFPMEISILTTLEEHVDEKSLFDASYASFYEMGILNKSSNKHSIQDILTAFGFGIVESAKDKGKISITLNGYPWFPQEYNAKSFGYIRGAIVGFLDGTTGKKHRIESVTPKMEGNVFIVSVEVKEY